MAQRTIVTYYSDVSGTEIDKSGVGVHFNLDGDAFEIDLSEEEHEALAPGTRAVCGGSTTCERQPFSAAACSWRGRYRE